MSKKTFATIIALLFSIRTFSQTNVPIASLNKLLGRGMNMGNMFEAPSDGEWGNPYKDDYFKRISTLGFSHVRVPIRWDVPARASQMAPYTLNATFLARIKEVVDNAISNKLYVIINMHHHEGLYANPAADKEKFLSQWSQIAEYFKGNDEKLLFEVMNEPHGNLTTNLWNIYFDDALQVIRKTNPTRAVLMGMANYGGLAGLPFIKLPNDKNIIITIHYYDPFNFTHQGAEWVGGDAQKWLGTKWEDLEIERNQIISEFEPLITFSKEQNVPVHIGEFGAYSKADIESRTKWTTYLARYFEQQGWSWAYWEWSAGFGIFDPSNNLINAKLADALLKNPMPEAKKLNTKVLYQSEFANDDNGWALGTQPGSTASLTRESKSLIIDVKTAVKDGWHVQLNKQSINIENKKRYQVTVRASATNPSAVTCYIAKASAPYNSYSGFTSFNIGSAEKEYSYTFIMNEPTDNAARMSFDLGLSISKITINSVKIEEILDTDKPKNPVIDPVLAEEIILEASVKIAPNPVIDKVEISFDRGIEQVDLVDVRGKLIGTNKVKNSGNSVSLNMKNLNSGQYVLLFYSAKRVFAKKIIK
jgi:endoglucanase